jgi:hypothetical protein
VIQHNNISNQYNINQHIINPNINFPSINYNNPLINNISNPITDYNQFNNPANNSIGAPISTKNNFNNTQFSNNIGMNAHNDNLNRSAQKLIKNIHEFTKVGFSGHGVKKVNQDNFFVFRNFNGSQNNIFMAVW